MTENNSANAARALKVGLVSISDRASEGVYADQGVPALKTWLARALESEYEVRERLIADDRKTIGQTIIELVDHDRCDLVMTTGGTGPSRRDVTPEATLDIATREMPGFGEQMRQISLHFVPTAILSRQVGVLRETADHAALVINLPGQPKAIAQTLEGLRDDQGGVIVSGLFAAIPFCIELIGGPLVQTNPEVVEAFKPRKSAKPA